MLLVVKLGFDYLVRLENLGYVVPFAASSITSAP